MMSMGVNVYEYLVNPYSLQGIKNIIEVPKGEDFCIVCDCTIEIFMVLYKMAQDHITLVTVPGHACLYDILNICRKDGKVDIELKSTYYEMSDTFVQELIEVRCVGDYYKLKITTKRNDDGSVTFSVPTLQVARIKEDAVPVFAPHGDEPGERGDQGSVDNILVITDKVDVLRVSPFRHYSKEIELKCNDKFGSFVEYWQSLPVPRKIIFRMEKDSQDVYMIESLRFECGRGFITAQYIGNMCDLNPLSAEDEVKDFMHRLGLDYKSAWERKKELISELQPGMLTYKVEDAMPKKEAQLSVVVDLHKELNVVQFYQNENGDYIAEVRCNDKMEAFHKKYSNCKPIFRAWTLDGIKYLTIKHEGDVVIDTSFWTFEKLTVPKYHYYSDVSLANVESNNSTTRRINIVKLNKVTRL